MPLPAITSSHRHTRKATAGFIAYHSYYRDDSNDTVHMMLQVMMWAFQRCSEGNGLGHYWTGAMVCLIMPGNFLGQPYYIRDILIGLNYSALEFVELRLLYERTSAPFP